MHALCSVYLPLPPALALALGLRALHLPRDPAQMARCVHHHFHHSTATTTTITITTHHHHHRSSAFHSPPNPHPTPALPCSLSLATANSDHDKLHEQAEAVRTQDLVEGHLLEQKRQRVKEVRQATGQLPYLRPCCHTCIPPAAAIHASPPPLPCMHPPTSTWSPKL